MAARMIFSVAVLLSIALQQGDGAGVTFDYATQSDWPTNFPICGKDAQSPVNIDRFSTGTRLMLSFKFHNYAVLPNEQVITNNGNGVAVVPKFDDDDQPMISGGGLPLFAKYILSSFHFHWGADSTKGSEHTINHVRYPMELHLVHYKSSYDDLDDALGHEDGLAVLGIMFVISTEDNPALAPFISHLSEIQDSTGANQITVTDMYSIAAFLPQDVKNFYRYQGSLTTPTCNEVVTWTVFKEPITVSATQMTEIRSLMDGNGDPIVDNYRDWQDLNGRKVYESKILF